jgi:Tol biopolymer transport system component
MSGPLRFLTLLAAAIGIAACDADHPAAPSTPSELAQLRGVAIALTVDAQTGRVTQAGPSHSRAGGPGPSFALLGQNEIAVATSNFDRSAVGAYTKKKVRIRFDVELTNQLQGATLVTPTFPQPPLGQQSLMLFPFRIDRIVGKGSVAQSDDWDGDGTPGSGKPYNFFNDPQCKATPTACYRWKGFPSPLAAGATSPAKTIGFDVDPEVQSFEVYLVLAADLKNGGTMPGTLNGTLTGTVTSPERGALTNVMVTLSPGGQTARTDALGRYTFASVVPGTVTLTLGDLPLQCSAPDPKSVVVSAGATATADVSVACPDRVDRINRIAFVSVSNDKEQIFVINADGTGRKQLSDGSANDSEPSWSPDGSKIAFTSYDGRRAQIFVMNADGTGRKQISDGSTADVQPAWSPDGRRIAFSSVNDHGYHQIFVMNADGTGRKPVSPESAYEDFHPSWSPDGSQIAFSTGEFAHSSLIFVMNADGTGRKRLSGASDRDFEPSWSPDGSQIAFSSYVAPLGVFIYVMNAEGTGRKRVSSRLTGIDGNPSWSPDGSQIAYDSSDLYGSESRQIFVVNADGTERYQLTTGSNPSYYPRWKP